MADIKQWVNLTKDDKWKGEKIASRDEMGIWRKLRIKFKEKKIAVGWVTKKADPNNAVYSANEKNLLAFNVREYSRRPIMTDNQGVVDIDVQVSLAGGDKFSVKVEDRKGKTVMSKDLFTRRKLYFQVIRMKGVTAISSADINGMRNEFWNTGEKLYINMVSISPKKSTIVSMRNLNDEDRAIKRFVLGQTRKAYDTAKNPYCFAVLAVRRNGIPEDEVLSIPAVFGAGRSCTITTQKVLFDTVDPSDEYYKSLEWMPDSGGRERIPKASLTRVGTNQIRIDTTGFTRGRGMLNYSMRVLGINGRGLSLPDNNFTLVASEDAETGAAVPSAEIMAVLVHEIAHKIGMVPGPQGTRSLDEQSTYYDGRGHSGGHCNHGVGLLPTYDVGGINPDCTMFGDTRAGTANFCEDCRKSLRKLDLRASTNVGIRTQF